MGREGGGKDCDGVRAVAGMKQILQMEKGSTFCTKKFMAPSKKSSYETLKLLLCNAVKVADLMDEEALQSMEEQGK